MKKELNYTCNQLNEPQIEYLKEIGLSKDSIKLYDLLLKNGPLTAKEAATYTGSFASANYRLLYFLEEKKLIQRLPEKPLKYQALRVSKGLQTSFYTESNRLQQLINSTYSVQSGATDSAEVILGRENVYKKYINLAARAEKQVSIYSIGIAYSKQLFNSQADLVKRGVTVRHIIQELQPQNFYIINKWQKLGINLRFYKHQRGYHLTIIDDQVAIVTFSNPDDTEQRFSMVTANHSNVEIFQIQFDDLWAQAKPLKI